MTKPSRGRYLIKVFGDVCHLCTWPVAPDEATLDHLTPRSFGGYDKRKNFAIAHFACNNARGNLTVERCTELVAHLRFRLDRKPTTGEVVTAFRAEHRRLAELVRIAKGRHRPWCASQHGFTGSGDRHPCDCGRVA